MKARITGILFLLTVSNNYVQLKGEEIFDKNIATVQATAFVAGYIAASVIDTSVDSFIAPQHSLMKLGTRLSAEITLAIVSYYYGKKINAIRVVDRRAYYNSSYDKATTAWHIGYNSWEVHRSLRAYIYQLSRHHGSWLTVDSIYGIFHACALKENYKKL